MASVRVRILLVSDAVDVTAFVCRTLEAAGLDVLHAATSAEGLKCARAEKPALVLLGPDLEDLTADEVCRGVRGDASLDDTLVIMSSRCQPERPAIDDLRAMADGYMAWPTGPEQLFAQLSAFVRCHQRSSFLRARVAELTLRNHELQVRHEQARASLHELEAVHTSLVASRQAGLRLIDELIGATQRLDATNLELHKEVAERTRVEAALRDSERRWKFALDGAGDGAWDWNIATDEATFSARWKTMLGYAEDEVGTRVDEWTKRVHPDDLESAMASVRAHLSGETASYVSEHRLLCKDGTYKWILDRGAVTSRDSAGNALRMIGTHVDLTARRQAEADRATVSKLESTGILAAGIAHDFNNLLTGVLMNVGMLKSVTLPAEEVALGLLEIEEAALAACNVTRQLVLLTRGGSGARQSVDVSGELRTAVALALSRSSVRGEVVVASDLWRIVADIEQIGLAFRGLVVNAREAMLDDGVVSVRAENVRVSPDSDGRTSIEPGPYVRIRVVDRGHGIPAELLPKIFDPYFSTKPRGSKNGMGLGLSICLAIARKHGGAILVDSTPGLETTFDLYLPAVVVAD